MDPSTPPRARSKEAPSQFSRGHSRLTQTNTQVPPAPMGSRSRGALKMVRVCLGWDRPALAVVLVLRPLCCLPNRSTARSIDRSLDHLVGRPCPREAHTHSHPTRQQTLSTVRHGHGRHRRGDGRPLRPPGLCQGRHHGVCTDQWVEASVLGRLIHRLLLPRHACTTGREPALQVPPGGAQARPRGHACLPRHPRAV